MSNNKPNVKVAERTEGHKHGHGAEELANAGRPPEPQQPCDPQSEAFLMAEQPPLVNTKTTNVQYWDDSKSCICSLNQLAKFTRLCE